MASVGKARFAKTDDIFPTRRESDDEDDTLLWAGRAVLEAEAGSHPSRVCYDGSLGCGLRHDEQVRLVFKFVPGISCPLYSSLAAGMFYLASHPNVQHKLHEELTTGISRDYLHACVNEILRIQPSVGLGLPRVVPSQGLTVCGQVLTPGTTIGAPIYTASRDSSVWGEDAEGFQPERWLENDGNLPTKKREFQPFSEGPMYASKTIFL